MNLLLDKVQDISRDKISFKETLKILEASAVNHAFKEKAISINDLTIIEKPDIEVGRIDLDDLSIWGFALPETIKRSRYFSLGQKY